MDEIFYYGDEWKEEGRSTTDIKLDTKVILMDIKRIIRECEEKDLTNEQFFIDFLDELNEYSVTY